MSSRILVDDVDRGPGQDNHPSAPAAPEPQAPAEPVEARDPAPVDAGEPADAPAEPDWAQKEREYKERIDALTRQRYEAHRERDQIRQEFQRWQQQQQAVPATPEQRARMEGYQARQAEEVGRSFDAACNDLYVKGRQEYGAEMDDAVQALRAVGWADRHDALAAVTRLPNGHRVYRELAKNLDNAARVLTLSPMDMAMELARMDYGAGGSQPAVSAGANESPTDPVRQVEVSRAPEPVRHIGGRSTQAERPLDHPSVTMAEFIRRRDRDQRRSRIAR